MENELLFKYGGGGTTVLHPIALGFTFIMVVLMFRLPRRFACLPIILTVLFIPLHQRLVIFGLDFMIIRILLMFGLIRVFKYSEFNQIKLNSIDKVMILWVISTIVSYTLLFGTLGAFINRLGFALDAIGVYLLFRCLIRDFEDMEVLIKVFVIGSVVVAFFMLLEKFTGRNAFAIFGGVPDFTLVRDGHRRCQGAFAHSLMAGSFGATFLPLALSLWWRGGSKKKIAIVGCIAATVITLTSRGSGPILAYLAAVGGLFMWSFRKHMRAIVLGLLFLLILMHIAMKAPIWALIGRVEIFGGSAGYHRYILFNEFIRRFDEWWLFGTKFTSNWGYGLWDITNMYVHIGVDGGLITLILFVSIIILSFRAIGNALLSTENEPRIQRNLWSLGASLFSHAVAFMGMAYFDQMKVIWYILIAMISVIKDLSIEVNIGSLRARV